MSFNDTCSLLLFVCLLLFFSKCALKSLAAASGSATIEVVSERNVVPKVEAEEDANKAAASSSEDAALITDAEAKSAITLTIKRDTAIVTVVFANETVRITANMGDEKIDFSFVHVRKGKMTMGITKKDMEAEKESNTTSLLETASEGTLLLDQILHLS